MINIGYLDVNGSQQGATSVKLMQDGDPVDTGEVYFCEWPVHGGFEGKK